MPVLLRNIVFLSYSGCRSGGWQAKLGLVKQSCLRTYSVPFTSSELHSIGTTVATCNPESVIKGAYNMTVYKVLVTQWIFAIERYSENWGGGLRSPEVIARNQLAIKTTIVSGLSCS